MIGDGSMSAGMAYEAMNNAAETTKQLIVILNDNDMSIAPPVGGMSAYMARLVSGGGYQSLRQLGKLGGQGPSRGRCSEAARKAEEFARGMVTGGTFFEELGFYYVGPIDGHDMDALVRVLQNAARDRRTSRCWSTSSPRRARATRPAESAADKYHGVVKFDVVTGEQAKAKADAPSYTKVFAQELIKQAERDDKIVAITAAMPRAPGSTCSRQRFPERTFDVGIAEQHAVTFAAGLAADGMKPFARSIRPSCSAATTRSSTTWPSSACRCASPWTAPGLVGADGADPRRLLRHRLPRRAAGHGADGRRRRGRARAHGRHRRGDRRPALAPSAIRAARASASRCPTPAEPLEIGRGRIVREGTAVAILSLRHAAAGEPAGRRHAGRARASRPPSPTPASPSRSTRT